MASERKRRIDLGDSYGSAKLKKGQEESGSDNDINPWTGMPFSAKYHSILNTRKKLPVYQFKDELIQCVKENQIIVVEGETGSGKTTQIPQFLLEAGLSKQGKKTIACTQPRRVAATSIAARVAEEMDVELGSEVGYTIRFEDVSDPSTTVLKFVTDGMLLREAMSDPLLSRYSAVVLDEIHERTLSTDIICGLLMEILPKRQKGSEAGLLQVVVMSATLDAAKIQEYFHNAPLMKVPGRTHPVEVFYTAKPEPNYVEAAIRTTLHIHECEGPGDILVFLTGEQEIEQACEEIREKANAMGKDVPELVCYPLYSSLPPHQQRKIFSAAPGPRVVGGPPGRKVVVSTNIAGKKVPRRDRIDTGWCLDHLNSLASNILKIFFSLRSVHQKQV